MGPKGLINRIKNLHAYYNEQFYVMLGDGYSVLDVTNFSSGRTSGRERKKLYIKLVIFSIFPFFLIVLSERINCVVFIRCQS